MQSNSKDAMRHRDNVVSIPTDPSVVSRIIEEHRIFKEAIEKSPMSYCVYDADDRLIAFNDTYMRLHPALASLIRSDGEVTGILYADLVRASLTGRIPHDRLEDEVARRVDAQQNADGNAVERDYGTSGVQRVIKYRLASGGTAGLAFDITELKSREDELMNAKAAAEAASDRARAALSTERQRKLQSRHLSELSEWLQSCKSLSELFLVIERFMARLFPDTAGELYVYSNSRDVLDAACQWHRAGAIRAHIQPDECWALRRGRILKHGAGLADLVCQHADDIDVHEPSEAPYLCVPIIAHGDTVGLLHIRFGPSCENPLGEPSLSFAIQCAEQISLAIANVKLRDELEDQSTRDPLTALYNRRHFMNCCRKNLQVSQATGKPMSVLSVDADHFKMFNDTHGHDAGDTVLLTLAEVMVGAVKDTGTVARIGGEEFSILLPDMDITAAIDVAETIRTKLAETAIRYGEDQVLPQVTISCGVAQAGKHGWTPQELLRSADKALYTAKDAGRNRVVAAGSDANEQK